MTSEHLAATVVLPAFNEETGLAALLPSLMALSLDRFEGIAVDGPADRLLWNAAQCAGADEPRIERVQRRGGDRHEELPPGAAGDGPANRVPGSRRSLEASSGA